MVLAACGWPPRLLTLLCAGRRVYVALGSAKLRYRGAGVRTVYWYTAGHEEMRDFFATRDATAP